MKYRHNLSACNRLCLPTGYWPKAFLNNNVNLNLDLRESTIKSVKSDMYKCTHSVRVQRKASFDLTATINKADNTKRTRILTTENCIQSNYSIENTQCCQRFIHFIYIWVLNAAHGLSREVRVAAARLLTPTHLSFTNVR